jgi:DNA-binding NtrC family response regulator
MLLAEDGDKGAGSCSSQDEAGGEEQPREKNSLFTILVLDSLYSIDSTLEGFLRKEGYPFILADSAKEALAKVRRFQPDLILLDCELKGLTCLTLLPELLLIHPRTAVILMASRPSVSSVVEAIQLGAVDFFERPLDLERLKTVIELQKALFSD